MKTLSAQAKAVSGAEVKRARMTTRELLWAVIEHAHLERFTCNNRAQVTLDLPEHVLAELCDWEADAAEDEMIDEAAA